MKYIALPNGLFRQRASFGMTVRTRHSQEQYAFQLFHIHTSKLIEAKQWTRSHS